MRNRKGLAQLVLRGVGIFDASVGFSVLVDGGYYFEYFTQVGERGHF